MTTTYDTLYISSGNDGYIIIDRVTFLLIAHPIFDKISSKSYFDLVDIYLFARTDGSLFVNHCLKQGIEVNESEHEIIEKFTEHCEVHKIPFCPVSFYLYDWSLSEDYLNRRQVLKKLWQIKDDLSIEQIDEPVENNELNIDEDYENENIDDDEISNEDDKNDDDEQF